jgi:ligand-binding sensor domain-containing protein/class 3 adenylate cyclase
MRQQLHKVFALLLSVAAASLPAQSLPEDKSLSRATVTAWNNRGGLPSDTVLDVVQDALGYMWLASYDGLVKFDGQTFNLLSPLNGGFSGHSARVLKVGPKGELWVGTNTDGLYLQENGAFTHFGKGEGLPDLSVRALAFDSRGALWVGTANGVSRQENDRFVAVALASKQADSPMKFGIVNFLLPLEDGSMLAGSNLPGLWRMSRDGVHPFLEDQIKEHLSFSAGFIDTKGELLLGSTSGEILVVNKNKVTETIKIPELVGSSVNAFYADPDGSLLMATDRGIISRRGSSFETFNSTNGLPSDVVSSICRDREGNLWVGTERGGLVKFSKAKFTSITRRDGLVSEAINCVEKDLSGNLWVGTDEGVSCFPAESPSPGGPGARAISTALAKLKNTRVRQIRSEADGSVWFSTYADDGLQILSPDGAMRSLSVRQGLPTNRVRFTYRTQSGEHWIGTAAGPALLSADGSIKALGTDSGLPNLFILCAEQAPDGSMWFGTDGGGAALGSFASGKASFKTFTTKDGLAGNVVFRIKADSHGRVWLCTSEGLSLYADGKFHKASKALGLEEQSVYEIFEDKASNLWVVAGHKVIVANREDLYAAATDNNRGFPITLRAYDQLDGLAGELSANAWSCVDPDGIVYLPTLKGVSVYDPLVVPRNDLPPPVLIERVDRGGKPLAERGAKYTVLPGKDRVTFTYTALSYVIPQRVNFEYRLEGFDRQWIKAGTARSISYTNLPPGTYRFHVKAENNDGVANENGATVIIKKEPYFYETPLFIIALILAAALIAFFAFRLRLRHLQARADKLDAMVTERTQELALERDKSENLLKNILPPSVAEELKATGKAQPRVFPTASILFADIVGFTSRSSARAPEEIIAELNELFTLFDGILERHGCERIKTLGDGYLAAAGVPVPVGDHAQRIVAAGVDMLKALSAFNAGRPYPVCVRVGVNSGPVVAGVVGVKKYIYDVFGDCVNMAFRLEALACPMGLMISGATERELSPGFKLVHRAGVSVKGKGLIDGAYVAWSENGTEALTDDEVISRYQAAQESFRAGRAEFALNLLERIDPTCMDQDVGQHLFTLKAEILKALKREKEAEQSTQISERFRQ